MADQPAAIEKAVQRHGVLTRFAESYDLDPAKVLAIVGATVFKGSKDEPPLSTEECAAALIVCNQYQLNPFTKEIYAFRSKGKLLIVVGVDGWSTIVNRQAAFNGVEFAEHFHENGHIHSVTCIIHRKDRAMPTVVTEYTHECKRNTDPWQNMPIRMTRNRAFIQCARIAFSISGIVDDDEAQTISGSPEFADPIGQGTTRTEQVKAVIQHKRGKTSAATPVEAQTIQAETVKAEPAQEQQQAQEATPAQQETQQQPAAAVAQELW